MDLETKIARAHATREESEDFAKGAKVWTRAELEKNAPGIDWAALLDAAQLGGAQKFQAYHSTAIPKLSALVGSEPLQAWKDWLAFHTLNQQADVLPKAFRDASFAFNGTALLGTPKERPRDELAMNAVSKALPDAVGKVYVDKYFPASSKAEIQKMVEEIKAAFARRVEALDWMAPSTKAEALKKVENDRGRRRLSRHVARLFVAHHRKRRLREPEECGAWPSIATRSRRSASRWTAPNGGCRRSS